MARKHHYNAEQINIAILQEWLTGRGKQPVTWATLVEVLRDIGLSTLALVIEAAKCSAGESINLYWSSIIEQYTVCVCVCVCVWVCVCVCVCCVCVTK